MTTRKTKKTVEMKKKEKEKEKEKEREEKFYEEALDMTKKFLVIQKDEQNYEVFDINRIIQPLIMSNKVCGHPDCADDPDGLCKVEKNYVITVLKTLRDEGIEVEGTDKFLVHILIQSFLRLQRLYKLEASEKFIRLLNTMDGQKKLSEFTKTLNSTESTYIKVLKELLATRKEKIKIKKKNQPTLANVFQE